VDWSLSCCQGSLRTACCNCYYTSTNYEERRFMTAPRSTKREHAYQQQRRASRIAITECPSCVIKSDDLYHIEETLSFRVIRNSAPYSIWDGQGVNDHLLIIPKKHTDKIGNLKGVAASEFLSLINKYETLGYNLFARAPASKNKSVVHQHTHLIQPNDKHVNFILYFRKPFYVRFSR